MRRCREREPQRRGVAEEASFEGHAVAAMAGLQLFVGLLLAADLTFTWAVRGLSRVQLALLSVSVLWLGTSAHLLLGSRSAQKYRPHFGKPLLSLASLIVTLVVLEQGLRLFTPLPPAYLHPPNARFIQRPDETNAPGIRSDAVTTTNEWGLRGPSIKVLSDKPNAFKIFTIGGSTTIGTFLDDCKTWPHLLMQDLNSRQNKPFVYVANAGMNGHNTADHLELLKRFPIVRQADLLTFLVGGNDMSATLAFEGRPAQSALATRAARSSFEPSPRYPLYTRLRVYALLERLRPLFGLGRPPNGPEWFTERRRLRAQSPIVPIPDLKTGLQEYRMRIASLAEFCRSTGQRCVFLTQPSLWRNDLSRSEENLVFMGWTGEMEHPKGYLRSSDLAIAMNEFNEALLEVCRKHELECFDLAFAIPKDTTAFYDDWHFNEHGARLVARFVADRLGKTALE